MSQQAVIYLRISLLGAPSMLVVLAGTGVLRGLQDTRTPLLVAVAANVVNIALNATFVLGLHWGIAGSAWGTAIAQTGAGRGLPCGRGRGARRAGVGMRPDRRGVTAAASRRSVAGPADPRAAGCPGPDDRDRRPAVATRPSRRSQVAMRIWSLFVFALDAIAIAAQAITGRYLGAGDVAGARAATRRMIGLGRRLRRAVLGDSAGCSGRCCPACSASRPASAACCWRSCWSSSCSSRSPASSSCWTECSSAPATRTTWPSPGWSTLAVFVAAAAVVVSSDAGLVALWLAYAAWMLARFATLTLRARSSRWLVTGAVRP